MRSQWKNIRATGMSKLALLLIVVSLVIFGMSALKLGPHYIDFSVLQGMLERLPNNSHKMSRSDILEHFSKQFRIENFGLKAKDVVIIERNREQTIVSLDYEIREQMFYNIDVVLAFEDRRTFQ